MLNTEPWVWVLVLIAVPACITLCLVIIDTVRKKGRFGINPTVPDCPRCGRKVSAIREPKSIGQFLWGGYTCPNCQCEIDKWGNELSAG